MPKALRVYWASFILKVIIVLSNHQKPINHKRHGIEREFCTMLLVDHFRQDLAAR